MRRAGWDQVADSVGERAVGLCAPVYVVFRARGCTEAEHVVIGIVAAARIYPGECYTEKAVADGV